MNEQIIRDYYYRRTRGVSCPDLLPPDERASAESTYDRRLQSARLFVQRLNHDAVPAS
jgi:hypothetical protein